LSDPAALLPHQADGTIATEAVELDLFRAATPSDEIREALRMALREGLRWDEIEFAASDTDTYGIALDAVCGRLDIPHSSLYGIPFARTRLGRALQRWFAWIGDGLPADVPREALEAGDLIAPEGQLPGTRLARLLRSLGIGWGRSRYEAALEELGDSRFSTRPHRREDETDEAYAARLQVRSRAADELSNLLGQLLRITPAVPERGSADPVVLSAPILARATLAYLDLVPVHGAAEPLTMGRLRSRLDEMADSDEPATSFSTALAQLRDGLADLRAWTQMGDDAKPWSSAGGRLHLTDLKHAGTTGRRRVFVLGLDADRVAGARVQNAIINDAAREVIASDGLPTTAMARDERAWMIARSLARLRGRVTLSYATGGNGEDRPVGPAHLLLQVYRLIKGDPSLTYSNLDEALGAPACPVPAAAGDALGPREAWLAALADGALLLDGEETVREAFPLLDAGMRARQADHDDQDLTPYHGLIPAAAGEFDPRRSRYPISPTSLELLAKCPLAWFYSYGLNIRPIEDPEYDPERWLDPTERGSLLHKLFERFGKEYKGRQGELADAAARDRILQLIDEIILEWRAKVPPPSETVFATEVAQLRQAALVFLESAREDDGEWIKFELEFKRDHPASFQLSDGAELRITGKIDRVDRLEDRKLRVIDYKTGSPGWYEPARTDGPLKGGRMLQPALYAAAAEQQCKGQVAAFEYRFPTPSGENRSVPYGPVQFRQARTVVQGLLAHPATGEFLPTNDSSD
ncbi:MAG TPA: PD-(D/E)XK nuclease family protein, partial [Gemmatimonadales bacterium]|nr:PD-(D/E)XK nuclease family protein [Gemmatimonadales bacterium]